MTTMHAGFRANPLLRPVVTVPPRPTTPLNIADIIAAACRFCLINIGDLGGNSRHDRIVLAREIIVDIARRRTTLSYPKLARILGRPNHSSVICVHQRMQNAPNVVFSIHGNAITRADASAEVERIIDDHCSRAAVVGNRHRRTD